MSKLRDYLELFKIRQSMLLILSGVLGYFIAKPSVFDLVAFLYFLLAAILSVFGTTGLNMYFDRDIDAIMFRTKNRPLPANRLDPDEAFFVSLTMAVLGIVIGYHLNFWVGTAILLGFLIDAFIYTVLMKRKTVLNIVVGAFAGGMLPFGGYMLATTRPDTYSIFLMLIVALWAIIHIWFIAIYYIDDYKAANIPMFPVVYGEKKTAIAGFFVVGLIYIIVVYFWLTGFIGYISLIFSTLMTAGTFALMASYLRTLDREKARKTYKFLSPYLGTLLLIMAIERVFFI